MKQRWFGQAYCPVCCVCVCNGAAMAGGTRNSKSASTPGGATPTHTVIIATITMPS